MEEKIKKASEILASYGYKLESPFEGFKDYWHPWHQGRKIWLMSFEQRIDRIIQIESNKPESQKHIRYKYFKPVIGQFKLSEAYAKRREAYANWSEAYAKRIEAYAKWREAYTKWSEAYAKLSEAYDKLSEAYAKLSEADAKRSEADAKWSDKPMEMYINELHNKECEGINWDEENREMLF